MESALIGTPLTLVGGCEGAETQNQQIWKTQINIPVTSYYILLVAGQNQRKELPSYPLNFPYSRISQPGPYLREITIEGVETFTANRRVDQVISVSRHFSRLPFSTPRSWLQRPRKPRVRFTWVNKIEAMYEILRVNVKVEPRLTQF